MPLNYTAAHSSRIKKPSSLRTSAKTSPFSSFRRTKPINHFPQGVGKNDSERSYADNSANTNTKYIFDESLPDVGQSHYIAESNLVNNVIQAIQHIQNTMFSSMPESRGGMNRTRIAQVLNFRKSLPPIVSVAHVHVLLNAPTKVEREIAELINSGRVRRLLLRGRGEGIHGLGDCLVLVEDLENMVTCSPSLDEQLKEKFLRILRDNTKTSAIHSSFFSPDESASLIRAGFLVSASSLSKNLSINPTLSNMPSNSEPSTLSSNQSTASEASGKQRFRDSIMMLSLPSMGPYLKLLGAARSHTLDILKKSRYSEAPLYLLKDRWDGSVETNNSLSSAKRARGESTGVLPGRTKKWKDLYGMNFRWALEEAIGSGLIELFDTGSVGPGVRSL